MKQSPISNKIIKIAKKQFSKQKRLHFLDHIILKHLSISRNKLHEAFARTAKNNMQIYISFYSKYQIIMFVKKTFLFTLYLT